MKRFLVILFSVCFFAVSSSVADEGYYDWQLSEILMQLQDIYGDTGAIYQSLQGLQDYSEQLDDIKSILEDLRDNGIDVDVQIDFVDDLQDFLDDYLDEFSSLLNEFYFWFEPDGVYYYERLEEVSDFLSDLDNFAYEHSMVFYDFIISQFEEYYFPGILVDQYDWLVDDLGDILLQIVSKLGTIQTDIAAMKVTLSNCYTLLSYIRNDVSSIVSNSGNLSYLSFLVNLDEIMFSTYDIVDYLSDVNDQLIWLSEIAGDISVINNNVGAIKSDVSIIKNYLNRIDYNVAEIDEFVGDIWEELAEQGLSLDHIASSLDMFSGLLTTNLLSSSYTNDVSIDEQFFDDYDSSDWTSATWNWWAKLLQHYSSSDWDSSTWNTIREFFGDYDSSQFGSSSWSGLSEFCINYSVSDWSEVQWNHMGAFFDALDFAGFTSSNGLLVVRKLFQDYYNSDFSDSSWDHIDEFFDHYHDSTWDNVAWDSFRKLVMDYYDDSVDSGVSDSDIDAGFTNMTYSTFHDLNFFQRVSIALWKLAFWKDPSSFDDDSDDSDFDDLQDSVESFGDDIKSFGDDLDDSSDDLATSIKRINSAVRGFAPSSSSSVNKTLKIWEEHTLCGLTIPAGFVDFSSGSAGVLYNGCRSFVRTGMIAISGAVFSFYFIRFWWRLIVFGFRFINWGVRSVASLKVQPFDFVADLFGGK